MFEISGRGVFIGEADVALGMAFAEKIRNEGFSVKITEQHNLLNPDNIIGKKAYIVEFTSRSSSIFMP